MVTLDFLQMVIASAIEHAHLNDPDDSRGTPWDEIPISQDISHHYARAILHVFGEMDLEVVVNESAREARR